jgi:hypothetical protein
MKWNREILSYQKQVETASITARARRVSAAGVGNQLNRQNGLPPDNYSTPWPSQADDNRLS